MSTKITGITAEGRTEAAQANALEMRQAEAASDVRGRYAARISAARWPRKIMLWFAMHEEIRKAKAQIESELAPRDGLYIRSEQEPP